MITADPMLSHTPPSSAADPEPRRLREHGHRAVRELLLQDERPERLAITLAPVCGALRGAVQTLEGLLPEAERPVLQVRGHVLGRRADERRLVVVDGACSVRRDVRDDAASHQVDDERREPDLEHVCPERHAHVAFRFARVHDGLDDRLQAPPAEDVRQRLEPRTEPGQRIERTDPQTLWTASRA
jgi:hypothetical protein